MYRNPPAPQQKTNKTTKNKTPLKKNKEDEN